MTARFVPWRELSSALSLQLTAFSPYTVPGFVALFEQEGGRGGYYVIDDGDETAAAMPVVEFGTGFFARLQAMVDGLPAPVWISPDRIERAADLRRMIVEGIAQRKYLQAHLTDFENLLTHINGLIIPKVTSVVDLAKTEFPAEWLPPDKTLRAEIAKATREGLSVASFDPVTQMAQFVELMTKTERRHKRSPKYSPAFWNGFAELSRADTRFRWLCVQSHGRLAAVHIFIVDRDTALNWQIFYDKTYSSLKPNQAITAYAANMLRRAGVRYLNLGATPPEAAGVSAYKSKWGGVDQYYRVFVFRSALGRFLW